MKEIAAAPARRAYAASIVGMAALWVSVANRLLYPAYYASHHADADIDATVHAVYALAFALAALVFFVARERLESALFAHGRFVAALGPLGSIGVLIPVFCSGYSGLAAASVLIGALLVVGYISVHFTYWACRASTLSPRDAGLSVTVSLALFFAIGFAFAALGVHSVAIAAACPLVSAAMVMANTDNAALPRSSDSAEQDESEDAAGTVQDRDLELFAEAYGLSKRETELAACAQRNYSTRKIAEELFIAESTVYTHFKRIYRKTGVHSKQELVGLMNAKAQKAPKRSESA